MKVSLVNARIMLDRVRPDRAVHRRIRGIDMVLPRRHVLPYMARPGSPYAQNLVDVAVELGQRVDSLVVLDIGANIGDSALLMLDSVDCRIVCVEGDPQWLTYLHKNLGSDRRVAIEPALVSADASSQFVEVVHAEVGTSHVVPSREGGTPTLPLEQLMAKHPELREVRLVKTDTDGFDVKLALASATVFADSRPVIFFEYDPRPTRVLTPELEPSDIWDGLADEGYEFGIVWTNGGHFLGSGSVRDLTERSKLLEEPDHQLGYGFWDVAVAHRDDAEGMAALQAMAEHPKWVFPTEWT